LGKVDVEAQLQAEDVDGDAVADVEVEPAFVHVNGKVIERLDEKTVPVRIKLLGAPAVGFEVGKVAVEPNSLALRAPRSLLQELNALDLTCDIAEAEGDVNRRVKVLLPKGVEAVGSDRVRVRVEITGKPETSVEVVPLPTPSSVLPAPAGSPR
jgi:YbbR domain-containing protein